jgi:hypothetical protein
MSRRGRCKPAAGIQSINFHSPNNTGKGGVSKLSPRSIAKPTNRYDGAKRISLPGNEIAKPTNRYDEAKRISLPGNEHACPKTVTAMDLSTLKRVETTRIWELAPSVPSNSRYKAKIPTLTKMSSQIGSCVTSMTLPTT